MPYKKDTENVAERKKIRLCHGDRFFILAGTRSKGVYKLLVVSRHVRLLVVQEIIFG